MLYRPVFRLALPLTGVLTLLMALFRLTPYDGSAVRAFLLPPADCDAPCFMGVRPGFMADDDAFRLMRAHPWVFGLNMDYYLGHSGGWVTWDWSGAQPPFTARTGLDSLWIDYHQVRNINVMTTIPFGDIWLTLGPPDWVNKSTSGRDDIDLIYAYVPYGFLISLDIACPARVEDLWRAPANLFWVEALDASADPGPQTPHAMLTCAR